MKTKKVLLWAIALFILDQIIKVVIDKYFIEVKFDIIPPLLYFKPSFNYKYSWINSLFGLGMGFWTHIIIFSFVSIMAVCIYDWMKTISGNDKLLNIAFVFGFAGVISGYIGTIVWNGCLDYIYLKPLFVFDLKDLYINCFLVLLMWYVIKNWKQLQSIKSNEMFHHFKRRITIGFKKLKLKMK